MCPRLLYWTVNFIEHFHQHRKFYGTAQLWNEIPRVIECSLPRPAFSPLKLGTLLDRPLREMDEVLWGDNIHSTAENMPFTSATKLTSAVEAAVIGGSMAEHHSSGGWMTTSGERGRPMCVCVSLGTCMPVHLSV